MDLVYIVVPALLLAIALAAVWLDRWSVPVILVALGAGILFGSDILGLWHFDDIELANSVANLALVFILFDGGFSTKRSNFQAVALPAGGLATWGVVLTALVTFGVLHGWCNWPLHKALLLAAIISSTDAAAIFSMLRRQSLPPKLSSIVEIESAANDPMAILLTVAVIDGITSARAAWLTSMAVFVWKFAVGPICGWYLAKAALWLPLCGHSVLTGTKGTSDSLIKRSLIDQVGASVMCKVGVLAVAAALMLNAGGTGAGAGTASGVDS